MRRLLLGALAALTTVGLEGELTLVTGRTSHVAISINGNANPELPFVGVNFAILLGRMPFISSVGGAGASEPGVTGGGSGVSL